MNSYKNIPLWENTRRIKVLQEFRPAQPIVKLRHYRKLAFLLIALIVLAGFQPEPAKTQDIEQLRKAAEQGNASAQYSLGVMYNTGEGVPQDYQEAVSWYHKAAEQGHASAQYNLGVRYVNGEGVPQDYQEAVSWWRKAAEQGDAIAQYNLGVSYDNRRGCAPGLRPSPQVG